MRIGKWRMVHQDWLDERLTEGIERASKIVSLERELKRLHGGERAVKRFVRELSAKEIVPEEVKYRLGRLDDNDPTYEAVAKVLQRQGEIELMALLPPGVSNEERQYAAGRAAAVEDCLHMLAGIRAEGRRLIAGEAAS